MNPLRSVAVHPISDIADRQHGIVTREQLLARDIARSTVNSWVKHGRLRQLHQGVYLVEGSPQSWHVRAQADLRYLDRQARRIVNDHWVPHVAAIGGMAAGSLHGFPWIPRPDRALVVANRASRSRRVVSRHLEALRPVDVRVVEGLPTTVPVLALLEADGLRRATLENLLVELPRQGVLTLEDVVAGAQRFSTSWGASRVVRILEALSPELLRTRSGREREVVRALQARGVGDFEVNRRIRFPEATIEFDLLFGRHAEEIDGPHHLLPEQRRWDEQRDRIARRHGYTVDRTTTADLDLDLDLAVDAMLARVEEARSSTA